MPSVAVQTEIVALADAPHLVPVVARWHWEEWGAADPAGSLTTWTDGLRARSLRDRVPMSWVALVAGVPAGSVALIECDMVTHPELTPWLSGLLVLPAYRQHGLGSALTAHCEAAAAALGVRRMYLYTDEAAGFYAKRGWSPIATEWYEGALKTLMLKDLDPG